MHFFSSHVKYIIKFPQSLAQSWTQPDLLAAQIPKLNARTDSPESEIEMETIARYTNICDEAVRDFREGEISLIDNMAFVQAGNPTYVPNKTYNSRP